MKSNGCSGHVVVVFLLAATISCGGGGGSGSNAQVCREIGVLSETSCNQLSLDVDSYLGLSTGGNPDPLVQFYDDASDYTEGSESICTTVKMSADDQWAVWFVQHGLDANEEDSIDLSEYQGGSIAFSVKSPIDLIVGIRSGNVPAGEESSKTSLSSLSTFTPDNTWHEVTVPIAYLEGDYPKADLSKIKVYFVIGATSDVSGETQGEVSFWVDDVRWVKAPKGAETPSTAGLEWIQITPAYPTPEANSTQQFKAIGYFEDGQLKDITSAVDWTSSHSGVSVCNHAGCKGQVDIVEQLYAVITAHDPVTGVLGHNVLLYEDQNYLNISETQLNDVRTTVISASPFEPVKLSLQFTIWNDSQCSSCNDFIAFGLDEAFKGAYPVGIPGLYPGRSGRADHYLTAPGSTGTYTIFALLVQDCTMDDVGTHYVDAYSDADGLSPVVTLIVQ